MIRALIEKDLKLYFRNPFFALITGLGLVAVIVLYFLLPAQADDSLSTALVLPADTSTEMRAFLSDAFESDLLASQQELMTAVEAGDYAAGMVLTDAMLDDLANGQPVDVPLYTAPGTTPELKKALVSLYTAGLNNVNYTAAEEQLHITDHVIVLGPDLLDINEALALRDRMLPMLIMMMFAIELMGLANLISEEVTRGTARALLVTPLRVRQFFSAKMLMGVGLAFLEVLVLAAATGRLFASPAIVAVALLIGSLLMTGVAFFIAAFASGFMSVMAWSVLFLLILMLPGFNVMFPTMASAWIRIIPSYYLVDTLHLALNYGAGWGQVGSNLLILFASGLVFLLLGSLFLRRRFQ
ncbi:MAG: type transport system permease protein [Chloroflexota bacterium]|nr:type transport system permease protein [Chloroflexota bacterium]